MKNLFLKLCMKIVTTMEKKYYKIFEFEIDKISLI